MNARVRLSRTALLAAAQVLLILGLIEARHPYFFLQDDNRNFLLPHLVHNWRAIRSHEIAEFNFFQYCGAPALANAQSQSLYPPSYAATALSFLLFSHPFASIDFLVAFHLLLGAVGACFCFRELRLSDASAAWAAGAAVLNSFAIYVGNSWPGASAAAAYLPWTLVFALRFAQGRKWAATGLVLSNLLWFLNGYLNLLLYGLVFEAVFFLFAVHRLRVPRGRAVLALAANGTVAALLAGPLLLPQLYQVAHSALRASRMPYEMFSAAAYTPQLWLLGLVRPFSELPVASLSGAVFDIERHSAYASHVSYPIAAAAVLGLFLLWRGRLGGTARPGSLLAACAFVSFLASWGVLCPVLYRLPLFDRMRWPFKWQFLTAFFLAGLAGWTLDRILANLAPSRKTLRLVILAGVFLATLANFAALYAGMPIRAFRLSAAPLPAPEPLADSLSSGRIVTVDYPFYSLDAPASLGFSQPTLFALQGFGGYDPLVLQRNDQIALHLNHLSSLSCQQAIDHLEHLRRWAVAYYVVNPAAPDCGANLLSKGFTLLHQDSRRRIFRDEKAAPFVSWESGLADGIRCHLGINALDCRVTDAADRRIRLRFAAHEFFSLHAQGRVIPFDRDRDQIVFRLPAGVPSFELRYRDPLFAAGWKIALATLLVFSVLFWVGSVRQFSLIPRAGREAWNQALLGLKGAAFNVEANPDRCPRF